MRIIVLAAVCASCLTGIAEVSAQCTATAGTIELTLDQADPGTFNYQWSVTNNDGGVGNRLEEVYFEKDVATYSGASVAIPTWSDSISVVDTWNAIGFTYVSGTQIFNGATQTYNYQLNQFVGNVRVRTVQRNGQTEDFLQFQNLESGCPLPVELTSFSVVVKAGKAHLTWETASERNTAGFEVQVKHGGEFSQIGFVGAFGNTDEPQRYSFSYDLDASRTSAFRLRIVDNDGSFAYSSVVELAAHLARGFDVSEPFPNPFMNKTEFEVAVDAQQTVRVEIFDMLGRRVRVLYDDWVESGRPQPIRFDAGDLRGGLYLVSTTGERFKLSRVVTLLR